MKINVNVRRRNPWFWAGLVGTILAAMGVSPEMFTSWSAVWEALRGLVSNPYQIGCVVLAVLGVLVDPTTHGLGDSSRALKYGKPSKE